MTKQEINRRYYHDHKVEIRAYRAANKEKRSKTFKVWYQKNHAQQIERSQKWHKTPEGKASVKKYQQSHRPELRKYTQHRRHADPLRFRAYVQTRRARLTQAGGLTLQTIQQAYESNIRRFGVLTCHLCERPIKFGQDSVDHKTPITRGGSNQLNNLDIAHRVCNSAKNNKTVAEYLMAKSGAFDD